MKKNVCHLSHLFVQAYQKKVKNLVLADRWLKVSATGSDVKTSETYRNSNYIA